MGASKYILLSYPLSERTPLYGGTPEVQIKSDKSILNGSSCNTFLLSFSNHSGTHIDAPKHFHDSGKRITEYGAGDFVFSRPYIIDCPVGENELIEPEKLAGIKECDLLLIRTGFFKHRSEDKYFKYNPGISPETAKWIRKNYPEIRAVGIDTISVSAYQKRSEGRQTHKFFLCGKEPILLIEDMDLSGNLSRVSRVFAVPLMADNVDSMPCTVIGECI